MLGEEEPRMDIKLKDETQCSVCAKCMMACPQKAIILKKGKLNYYPQIDEDKCIKCGACAEGCPVSCIKEGDTKYEIDESMCIECGACAGVCPVGAPEQE